MPLLRRKVRDAMRELEDAVVVLHGAEERAAGRGPQVTESQLSVERARGHYERARDALRGLALTPEERRRATALLDTVGLLLALREAVGADVSLAARFLS